MQNRLCLEWFRNRRCSWWCQWLWLIRVLTNTN